MSGIIALFHRDRRPVDPGDLGRMITRIAHRGPDGSQAWSQGAVGLGQVMLRTTPESLREILPREYPELALAITADARIDNRSELIQSLQLQDRQASEISDSYLIAMAYRRWGENSPQYLLGDFAYVIWDLHQQQLFCARDHLGLKPLYLYLTSEMLVLGSELRALLSLPQVPRQLNEVWLANYLVQNRKGDLDPIIDHHTSLYQDLNPLPAGHWLRVDYNHHQQTHYWQLDPHKEIHYPKDQEYVDTFRDMFSNAVSSRLRSHSAIGIQLSGGLDSSSIACTALLNSSEQSQPLHTYTLSFEDLSIQDRAPVDESSYLEAVLNQGPFISHSVPINGSSPCRDPDHQIYWHEDTPFFSPGLYFFRAAYQAAQTDQLPILMSGSGGDFVVSHGLSQLGELSRSGHWLQLIRQVQVMRTFQRSPWLTLADFVWRHHLQPKLVRGPLHPMNQYLNRHSPHAPMLVHPQLAHRVNLPDHIAARSAHRQSHQSSRGKHYLDLTHTLQYFLLTLDKTAARFGIEARHPFLDRRLVEFCLGLPIEYKLRHGYGRWILRKSMAGTLPPLVQWRQAKADFTSIQIRSLLTGEATLIDSVLSLRETPLLGEYVDPKTLAILHHRVQLIRKQGNYTHPRVIQDATLTWFILNLSIWLSRVEISG